MAENFLLAILIEEEEHEENLLLDLISGRRQNKSVDRLFTNRRLEGAYKLTVQQRLFGNEYKFREYFRLSIELFQLVLQHIRDDITKHPYNRHQNPISPEEKLSLTLRFLATGESYRSLAFQYRIHHSWISICIKQVLQSIVRRMLHICIPQPSKEQMESNALDFNNLWNYPNCCASIDGKHIRIRCPSKAGSLYFNYKNFHSIVLLAIVDARYRFVAIDVGSYGREGDAGIFLKSNIKKQIAANCFNLPPSRFIPGTNIEQPHVLLGDEAFSLTTNMMKPYSQTQAKHDNTKAIYNYRHSRARRTSENAFGIMCQYFRVFYTPIAVVPEVVDNIILSACILHNMLRNAKISCPNENANTVMELPKENMITVNATCDKRASFEAYGVRDNFKTYFNTIGTVPWQDNIVSRID